MVRNIKGKPGVGIPHGQGLAVNMKGAVADQLDHHAFHKHLDDWMDGFRGAVKPTVRQYNQQMEKALVNGGFSPKVAKQLRVAAQNQQKAYGILPDDIFDVIPQRIT